MKRKYIEDFEIALIEDDEPDRAPNLEAVDRLVESMQKVGLGAPLLVHVLEAEGGDKRYKRISGWHRIEALRRLGKEFVPTILVWCTDVEARLLTITENLHRAELTRLERDEQIAEWMKLREAELTQEGIVQHAHNHQGGRPGHEAQVAEELGIDRNDARRAKQTAGLTEEAKETARRLGLDRNRTALLAAAKHDTAEAQIEALKTWKGSSATMPPRSPRPKAEEGTDVPDAEVRAEAAEELRDWWRKWRDEEFATEIYLEIGRAMGRSA